MGSTGDPGSSQLAATLQRYGLARKSSAFPAELAVPWPSLEGLGVKSLSAEVLGREELGLGSRFKPLLCIAGCLEHVFREVKRRVGCMLVGSL